MKRRWRWVTRDAMSLFVKVWEKEVEPFFIQGHWFQPGMDHGTLNAITFEETFGIEIPYGGCLKVCFSAEVVEDSE